MTKLGQIYRCEICGNVVEVVGTGAGTLVCCGQKMTLQTANTVDASHEKHVPVVTVADGKISVKVGAVPHPMEEAHYIQWIELLFDDMVERHILKPGDAPEAVFEHSPKNFSVRAFCNLHGLWTA